MIRIRPVRNAFFALLLVNLAYFAWAHWVDAPRPAPVNEAIAKLPKLKLAEEAPPSPGPEPASPEKTAMNQQPAACMSVGPFADLARSAQAAALLREKGFDPHQRAEAGQTSAGFWVFVGGLNQADTDHALVTLEHNGIRDALVMPETPEAGRRLSLGVYSERSRAQRRADAIRQTGLKAEVAERKIPGSIYWVDLSPPPGMNTIALQDLLADGVSSRVAVQPCPAAQAAAATPAAPVAPAPAASSAAAQSTQVAGAAQLR